MGNQQIKLRIIITITIGVCILIVAILFLRQNVQQHSTGGSGVYTPGHLILTGYETTSNDTSKIAIGSFFSTNQQKNIRTFIGALLFEKDPLAEYSGAILPGSVDVNYRTSIITFKTKIVKPEITYTVTYNTLNDEMHVFDNKNQSLTPIHNPDGTPFKSFRTSSQLAR